MLENEIFGYVFQNTALLDEALTTPSFRMTTPTAIDNQRLEFLGDAVLGLLATDWLFTNIPVAKEGALTGKRQHMVSTLALCNAAKGTGLVERLKRNKGAAPLPENAKMIADAVEAVLGAAWLDGGMIAAKKIFDFLGLAQNSKYGELDGNPKSALQHLTQSMSPPRMPEYRLVKTQGTSNSPIFTVEVFVENIGSALGTAGARKDAEAKAASALLAIIEK